jgi:hypothetical protein
MNPTDEKEPRLPDEAEALLESWPIPERDDSDWEGLALQIDARIEHTDVGSTDDALLMAPLPEGAEDAVESERRSHPRVKRPSDGGLAALAKATMLVRDEFQKTELAHATLDVARKARLAPRPRVARATVAARVADPPQATPEEVVVTFLAMLELIRLKQIIALQASVFGEIELAPAPPASANLPAGASTPAALVEEPALSHPAAY